MDARNYLSPITLAVGRGRGLIRKLKKSAQVFFFLSKGLNSECDSDSRLQRPISMVIHYEKKRRIKIAAIPPYINI